MNRKIAGCLITLSILVISVFAGIASVNKVTAVAPSVLFLSLPAGSTPVVPVYYNGFVYYPSYQYGLVMKAASTLLSGYSNLTSSTGSFNRNFFGAAMDSSTGNLWLTRRNMGNDGTPGGITMVTPAGVETNIYSVSDTSGFEGIGIHNGFAYVAKDLTLYKIAITSPYAVSTYGISGGVSTYSGFKVDGSNQIWFTGIIFNKLCKFDGSVVTCYSGFSRPLGLAISGSTGYVAENNPNGNIQTVNLNTGAISSTSSTTGTPYGMAVVLGTPVWSSGGSVNAHDHKICILNGACVDTGKDNFFMDGNGLGKIFFGYLGSSGIGVISDLVQTATYTYTSATINQYTSGGNLIFIAPVQGISTSTVTVTITSTITAGATSTTTTTSTTSSSTTSSSGQIEQKVGSNAFFVGPYAKRAGEKFISGSTMIGKSVSTFSIKLAKAGSPVGTLTAVMRDSSDSIVYTFGTLDASTLSSNFATSTFKGTNSITIQAGYRVLIEYSSASSDAVIVAYGQVILDNDKIFMTVSNGATYSDFPGTNIVFEVS